MMMYPIGLPYQFAFSSFAVRAGYFALLSSPVYRAKTTGF
jgi:hypothetical protein